MDTIENLCYMTVLFNGHSAFQSIPSENNTVLFNHMKIPVEISHICFNKAQFDIFSHSFLVFQVATGAF
jgi:hypothetical protein